MPNAITATGLTTATQAEMVAQLTLALQNIYGSDIVLTPDSPDGMEMMTFIQSVLDVLDLIKNVNAQFDPDQAIGRILDARVAFNGIQRQQGTYTVTPITIVSTAALTLQGLDQDTQPVYTVQDNAGNQWELMTTQVIPGAGAYTMNFRSAVLGAVLTVPNTITSPVTIVLGITSINNPTTYSSLGINQETDAALKIRRQISVALSSQGFNNSLRAALLNINGVTSAQVLENDADTTDGDGTPGHTIWVIVAGTGNPTDIGEAIYRKRNAGAGMRGAQYSIITQDDGSSFVVYWDDVSPQPLYIKFTATSIDGVNPPNVAGILSALPGLFVPGVYERVNINDLATLVQDIDPNTLVTNAGFSTSIGGSYTPTLLPTSKNLQFSVSSANIIITPIILSPVTWSLATGGTKTFTPTGGHGPYTFSMAANPSGGSVNSSTGFYTAGGTPATDIVQVTDSLANTATATVTVT